MSRKGRIALVAAAAGLLAAMVVASLRFAGRDTGESVDLEAVSRRDIARVVKASGQIDPRVKVDLSAHVVARIARLHVQEGDFIERGRPFLELEKEAFLAGRNRAAAELEIARSRQRRAEVELADARLKRRRAERLHAERVLSEEQREAAELAERSAELGVEQASEAVRQARAALDQAEDELHKTTIYAPLSGRVIDLNAEEGEVVVSGTMNNPASVIGTIADLSEILAQVDVDETEVVWVRPGQIARLAVDALPDRPYQGEVVEVGSSGFSRPDQPDVTFFKVKVLLAQPDEGLRPGMSVRAEIATARHSGALVVPIQAVVERRPAPAGAAAEEQQAGGVTRAAAAAAPGTESTPGSGALDEIKVVFVAAAGKALQRPVETGLSDATHVEILAGVGAGERVVTGPHRVLKDLEDGDAVRERRRGEPAERRRPAGRRADEDATGSD